MKTQTIFRSSATLLQSLLTSLIAVIFLQATPASAATFWVSNTSGSAATNGSLPWALAQAAANPGSDTVSFSIPGSGPFVITLSSILQAAEDWSGGNVVVDGTTQPGYSGSPLIVVDANGQQAAFGMSGDNCVIRGIAMYRFALVGVTITSSGTGAQGGHRIENCWIGFAPNGAGYLTNNGQGFANTNGIAAEVPYCTFQNNTISGVYNGIVLGGDPVLQPDTASNYWIAHSTYIANNQIGTTPDGESVIGNVSDGIFLGNGATYNHIAYNVIGGNQSAGVELLGSSGVVNYVYGNFIGTSPGGANIGNGELGVLISNRSNNNYIGNWVANYVYYNGLGGVAVGLSAPASGTAGDAHYNYVSYNWIYANNGAAAGVGVSVYGYSYYTNVAGNLIFGHTAHGVILLNAYSNYVYYNYLGYYVANQGFGVYSQSSAWNQIFSNAYGSNSLGTYGATGSYDYVY